MKGAKPHHVNWKRIVGDTDQEAISKFYVDIFELDGKDRENTIFTKADVGGKVVGSPRRERLREADGSHLAKRDQEMETWNIFV